MIQKLEEKYEVKVQLVMAPAKRARSSTLSGRVTPRAGGSITPRGRNQEARPQTAGSTRRRKSLGNPATSPDRPRAGGVTPRAAVTARPSTAGAVNRRDPQAGTSAQKPQQRVSGSTTPRYMESTSSAMAQSRPSPAHAARKLQRVATTPRSSGVSNRAEGRTARPSIASSTSRATRPKAATSPRTQEARASQEARKRGMILQARRPNAHRLRGLLDGTLRQGSSRMGVAV